MVWDACLSFLCIFMQVQRHRNITVRYQDEDETETFLLGSLEEVAHGDLEVYSPNSPLGKAIIGAHEGEDRHYELPSGGLMTVAVVKAEPFRG